MAKVIVTRSLEEEIERKFKKESPEVYDLIFTLKENPKKGKDIGAIGEIAIKELKYGTFRLYFIVDRFKVKFLKVEELKDLIIKFVRMSGKDDQQKVINEIKHVLRMLGEAGF
ncbi:MAG: hypothetical protein Q7S65_04160 [Nanoarchaeota archaeon]|nr:hypothetical protein [Nanoarchaeota archaeon]